MFKTQILNNEMGMKSNSSSSLNVDDIDSENDL